MSVPQPSDERNSQNLLAQMWQIARRHVPALLVLVFLTGALAGGLTRLQPSSYVSTVSFVVQTTSGASDTETLIRTMQALVTSEIIGADLVDATGSSLSPDEIVARIAVRRPPGAGVITAAVTDTDEERSRRLAAQLVPVFQDRIDELSQPEPGQLAVNYSIRSWGSGAVNTTVAPPPVARNAVLGLGLGVLLALVVLAVRAQRHPVLLTPQQAGEFFRLPLLGTLPTGSEDSVNPVDALGALMPATTALGWPASPRSVLVLGDASEDARVGAVLLPLSTVVGGEADVVLIDASNGSGSLTKQLRLQRRAGLREVLSGHTAARSALIPLSDVERAGDARSAARVWVLPAGRKGKNAGGAELAAVLRDLQRDFVVVVDAVQPAGSQPWTPVLDVVDAVLVLAELGTTPVAEARALGDALNVLSRRPVGVLLLGHDRFLSVRGGPAAGAAGETDQPGATTAKAGHPATRRSPTGAARPHQPEQASAVTSVLADETLGPNGEGHAPVATPGRRG